MRTITVFNTQSNTPSTFESDATTYGQIKNQIDGSDSMKVVVRETKVTLESDEAMLPEGDFTLFLFPGKVKSGWENEDDYNDDDYNDDDTSNEEILSAVSRLNAKVDRILSKIEELTYTLTLSPSDREQAMAKKREDDAKLEALAEEARNFKF
jgi:hypothetical protein